MKPDDPNYIVEEVDQSIEWFCDMVCQPTPIDEEAKEKVLKRMMNIGWLRQSEYELYKELTKSVDDD